MAQRMSLAEEMAELKTLSVADLLERYRALFGKEPRSRRREHLWRRCAWKLQEQRLGGLSGRAKDRLEELIGEMDLPLTARERTVSGALRSRQRPGLPPVGTVLSREWHGERIEVQIVDGGFEYQSEVYKTLSGAAKAITGAHWNGRLFFGLVERKKG